MGTTPQAISTWDEKGNPIADDKSAAAWDENGKPIDVTLEHSHMLGMDPRPRQSHVQEGFNKQTGQNETPEEHNKSLGPVVSTGMAIGTMGAPLAEGIIANGLRAGLTKVGAPIVRSLVGSYAGGHLGRYIGGRVGAPEAGETAGNIIGGITGGMGGRVPHSWGSLARHFMTGAEEAAAPEAAAGARLEPFRLTAPPSDTEAAIQGRLPFGRGETPTPGQKAPVTAPQAQEPANGGRLQPIGKRVGDIVDQATGSKPLEKNVPIGEQLTPAAKRGTLDTANQRLADVFDQATEPKTAETDPIKTKYPDPEVRRFVRANGERIVEAANGNPETLKAIHDLTRVDLRQALINAGEDMGQTTVSNSKFAGEGSIGREEAFDRLLGKGHSPDDIVRLAKQTGEGEPIYRVHDVGADPNEIDVSKHAHATTDLEDARSRIMPFRNQGTPQTISTARGNPGVDYDLHPRENQPAWVKMRHRNLKWEPIK